jgi:hypothetical protein
VIKATAKIEPLSPRGNGSAVEASHVNGGLTHDSPRRVCLNDIRELAYSKWESAGRPAGDCVRFWLEAEQEMLQQVDDRGTSHACPSE